VSIIEFEQELRELSESFVSMHQDESCAYPVTAADLHVLRNRVLGAIKKLYDAGGHCHDCYKQPIESFDDVDVLLHVIAGANTLRVSVARREQ
jgi:hypothetical protein